MNETLNQVSALVAGVLLGTIFFGGLWWTVQKGVSSKRPAYWFFVSMLLRTGITLTGFSFVVHGHWERLAACFVGFVVPRLIITWLTRVAEKPDSPIREAEHAP